MINIHFYESKLFEIVRVGYLLANGVFVVSESSSDDSSLDVIAGGGVVTAAYGDLVETTLRYLKDDAGREAVATRGLELFSRRDQAALLAPAVAKLTG